MRTKHFAWVTAGAISAGIVVLAVAATASFGQAPLRSARFNLAFQHDAAGAATAVDRQWTIDLGEGPPMGLVTGAAICGDDAFLVELLQGLIHKVRLSEGRRVATFGQIDESSSLHDPVAVAADCAGLLYVVELHSVAVMDSESGRVVHRFDAPLTFVNAPALATFDAISRSLYVQGLWTAEQNDWHTKSLDEMFAGDMIGYEMDLRTGATRPLVAAVERGCWSSSPNCLVEFVEKVRTPGTPAWIAAHAIGTRVGVFDAKNRLTRTIDVRSPVFLEDGRRVARRASSIEAKYAWQERNSVIRGLYSFDDAIVTVHSLNATKNWSFGHQIDFDVFMNIHRLDGFGVAADVRLPDLPVARDDDNLYVLDYGPGGRRRLGRAPITLLRIPIRGPWL